MGEKEDRVEWIGEAILKPLPANQTTILTYSCVKTQDTSAPDKGNFRSLPYKLMKFSSYKDILYNDQKV